MKATIPQTLTRFIKVNGESFRVTRGQSIFTHREGKIDIRIAGRGNWGALATDGYLYHTLQTFDAETGERLGYCDGKLPNSFPLSSVFEKSFFED